VTKGQDHPNQSKAMAVKKKGNPSITLQPGFSLTEKDDGTIDGTCVFECDQSLLNFLPQKGAAHPRDSRCEIYSRTITWMGLEKIQMVASYFGLVSSKTNPIIAYTPNTNKEPLETHPLFETFAGTQASPINGAVFDSETGAFLGFFDQTIKDLFGATGYLVPATMVSETYWQRSVPSLTKRMTIVNSITGFRKPPDVKNFLLLDMPYRQVGNFYQVTKQYLGSGPLGWSKKIYG